MNSAETDIDHFLRKRILCIFESANSKRKAKLKKARVLQEGSSCFFANANNQLPIIAAN